MNLKKPIIFLIILSNVVHFVYPELMAINRARAITIGKSLTFAPTVANDAVIKITASNVILDLAERTISQSNATAGLAGIEIDPNLSNIIIKNGFIKNVTGTGIKIGVGCSNITIENIQLEGIGNRGIDLQGTSTNTIDCCVIQQCTIRTSCTNTTSGDRGISLKNCIDTKVVNCVIEDTGNSAVDFAGLLLESCVNCNVEEVKILTCNGLALTAFKFDSTACSSIMASKARNNTASGAFTGIEFSGSSNFNVISDCLVLRNVASGNNTGISLGANSESNVLLNCTILANLATGNCRGFHLSGGINNSHNVILKCVIESNQGGTAASGITLENTLQTQLSELVIRSQQAPIVYGIHLLGTNTNCYVTNNSIANGMGASSFGIFDELNPSTSSFTGNHVFDHIVSYSVLYPSGITLPVIEGSLSNPVTGLPSGAGGLLDNVSIKP